MMKHLTTDEIKAFLAIAKLDEESLRLASRVNAHILKCDECMNKVKALQPQEWEEYTPEMKEREKEKQSQDFLKL